MRIQRFLTLVYVVVATLLLGQKPSFAQVAKTSTQDQSIQVFLDQIRNPKKMEARMRENPNLKNSSVLTKNLDQLKIERLPVQNRSLKALRKGGVDSGGGDEIGMEFLAALRESTFDFALINYDPKENFPWYDLTPFAMTLNVVAQDTPIKVDGELTTRVAVNDVSEKTIFVQREIWRAIKDPRIRNLIALNQVILMQQNKSSGFAQQAYVSAVAQGISPISIWFGKERIPSDEEIASTASHQCLWSYGSLERVTKALRSELQFCIAKVHTPEQIQLRVMHTDHLIERCVATCSLKSETQILAQRCRDWVSEKTNNLNALKRVAPQCLGGRE